MEYRLPFLDNDFQEFWYALPTTLRMDSRVGFQMLVESFPEFFRRIPWQRTGVPIGRASIGRKTREFVKRVHRRARRDIKRLGIRLYDSYALTDYGSWLRVEPARGFVTKVLTNPSAIYTELVSREQVLADWDRHIRGKDFSTSVCRYLTLELWFQQVFEKKYRTGPSDTYVLFGGKERH
jgi:asparagine synthase (glutamine-hydrolysing)